MNISFNELRHIKHSLPTGSISKIASNLQVSEQTVRNYFGAAKYEEGKTTGNHIQPGPDGGIVQLETTTILDLAKQMISESEAVGT